MGVKGLWDLVSPVARKVKLESLAGTRLAVDASIWLHQFLKAMRDKEGNALQSAHTLGFFRRICKLLFFNVKPVFVFDGGVPELKRHTMVERRNRRTGQVNNLAKTAEKLLGAQMKLAALKEAEKKRQSAPEAGKPEFVIENPVYFDYLANSPNKNSGKRDEYYLPALSRETRRDDPRIADEQELEEIIDRERRKDEAQNVVDTPREYDDSLRSKFSTIYPEVDLTRLDLNSDFFRCLPIEMQQELLIELKLRSRQTSHARLQEMVRDSPDAMSFSMAQIKQLMHRNDLTQKVMNMNDFLSGVMDEGTTIRRIAGEKRKQYVLVKNDAGRTGWSVGVTAGSDASQPLKVDVDDEGPNPSCETSDEDVLFEEVAVPRNVTLERPLDYSEQEEVPPRLSAEELRDLCARAGTVRRHITAFTLGSIYHHRNHAHCW